MVYKVKNNDILMNFLLTQGLKRGDVKNHLKYKQVYVNDVITTKFNYEIKAGDVVEIVKEKRSRKSVGYLSKKLVEYLIIFLNFSHLSLKISQFLKQ